VSWTWVLGTSAGLYLLKLAGLLVPERWLAHPRARQALGLVPVALMAALVAVQTVGSGRHLAVDARAAGLAAAAVALVLRAPFLLVVLAGAATAALVRLV